jgi:hypothetical protein
MNLKKWTYDTFPISPSAFPFLASAWVDTRVSASSTQSVFYRNPSAFICVHLRLIFVSLSDKTQEIQLKLSHIINENLDVQRFSEVYQGNSQIKSPQNKQRAQSTAIPVTTYEKAAPSRLRTRMTRIARIFTDPCASASSVQSVFYCPPPILICVHPRIKRSVFFPAIKKVV